MDMREQATGTLPDDHEALAPASSTRRGATTRRRASTGRFLVLAFVLMIVAVGAVPGYRWWRGYRTQQYRLACRTAADEKSWDRLKSASSQWLSWDDSNDDARMYLAEASVQLSDVETAVAALGNVSDSYHGVLQALAMRGDFQFSDLNRPYDAVDTWKRMLKINPGADLPRQRLIYFYAITMQRELLLQNIYRAMELGTEAPESYAYLLLGYEVTFSDGLMLTGEWLKAYPDDVALNVAHALYLAKFSPENTVNIYGMSLIMAGDETLINECLEKYPANLEVLAYHIDKAVIAGDMQRVLELLEQCPADAERDPRFWRFRGWYLAAQDRFAEADEALRTALELNAFDWRARLMLAGVLRQMDRPEEGAEEARIANLGKDLHRELFLIPNARALNSRIRGEIDQYFQVAAPELVKRAWGRRHE